MRRRYEMRSSRPSILGGREAHHGHVGLDDEANGGLYRRNSWRRPSERRARRGRSGLPRLDSYCRLGMSRMAITLVCPAWLGGAPIAGGNGVGVARVSVLGRKLRRGGRNRAARVRRGIYTELWCMPRHTAGEGEAASERE